MNAFLFLSPWDLLLDTMRNIQVQMLFSSFDEALVVDLINLGRFISCDSMVKVIILAVKNLIRCYQEKETMAILLLVKNSWQFKKQTLAQEKEIKMIKQKVLLLQLYMN